MEGPIQTPEIYLGYQYTRGNFGNPEGFQPEQTRIYTIPNNPKPNHVYLEGMWTSAPDHVALASDTGTIALTYFAKTVNIVAASDQRSTARITLDEQPAGAHAISTPDLYTLTSAPTYNAHTLRINITGKGFKLYTFTFG